MKEHYRPLEEPIYPQTITMVEEILEEMLDKKKNISGAYKEYLLGE